MYLFRQIRLSTLVFFCYLLSSIFLLLGNSFSAHLVSSPLLFRFNFVSRYQKVSIKSQLFFLKRNCFVLKRKKFRFNFDNFASNFVSISQISLQISFQFRKFRFKFRLKRKERDDRLEKITTRYACSYHLGVTREMVRGARGKMQSH